jgi:isochorismate synthase
VPAVAVGALPFEPSAEATIDVAETTVVRVDEDVTWRIDAGGSSPSSPFERVTTGAPHDAFGAPQLRPVPEAEGYTGAVRAAIEAIRSGGARKVVLARTIEVDAGRQLDPRALAARLRAVDPDAFVFAAPTDAGVMVGASPELLVSRRGLDVRANPLAGSAPRSGDPEEDRELARALETSSKDREEHAIVVEAVAEVLRPRCEELRWDPEPVLLETANVWHLSTRFHGVLREPAPTSLELVRALHPTPAVAGAPRDVARAMREELEPFDRGRYAGPVGWVDANGDGEWAIALRCAELRGDRATSYAGAGVVADSVPSMELAETDRKFRAFLDALRWS